mgnify:CR=1 FL=1
MGGGIKTLSMMCTTPLATWMPPVMTVALSPARVTNVMALPGAVPYTRTVRSPTSGRRGVRVVPS